MKRFKFGYRKETSRIVQETDSDRLINVFNHDEKRYSDIRRFMIHDVWLPNLTTKDGRGNPTEFF